MNFWELEAFAVFRNCWRMLAKYRLSIILGDGGCRAASVSKQEVVIGWNVMLRLRCACCSFRCDLMWQEIHTEQVMLTKLHLFTFLSAVSIPVHRRVNVPEVNRKSVWKEWGKFRKSSLILAQEVGSFISIRFYLCSSVNNRLCRKAALDS